MLMIVEAGSEMALFYYYPTFDICYISAISATVQLVVISFLNKGKSFIGVCPFCNFVRNTIYVLEIEML